MKVVIQRVSNAKVEVSGKICGKISKGLLVFVGFDKHDDKLSADKMISKLLSYRVFSDNEDKMNLSIKDVQGDLLIVSQFTLVAETETGTRPGFSTAKPPNEAKNLYDYFISQINNSHDHVESGKFGADMKVSLTNDGPVTFILSC
ncbi:MAG TPA: D-tyrosyl-tRNA(Tyr) deacylase [Candidatus Thioglobus sp.]|nr:D-tyrosyl-tRNA(Tyr) deacylase [Candidatus Thioglobus sp.]HIL42152.1 D-tyrosyl-tRNA(Tyr) deacylase [Gammaproteobacteria bacterium]